MARAWSTGHPRLSLSWPLRLSRAGRTLLLRTRDLHPATGRRGTQEATARRGGLLRQRQILRRLCRPCSAPASRRKLAHRLISTRQPPLAFTGGRPHALPRTTDERDGSAGGDWETGATVAARKHCSP